MRRASSGLMALLLAATAGAAVFRVEIPPVQGLAGMGAAGVGLAAPSPLIGSSILPAALAPATADLPPAGPRTDLDAAQLRWLYRTLVSAPSAQAMTRRGFSALVLGHDMPLAAASLAKDNTFTLAMRNALSQVVDSHLPAEERGRMAYALNLRFAKILDDVLRSGIFTEKDRLRLGRTKREFLDDPVMLEELTRSRQSQVRLNALEKSIQDAAPREAPSAGDVEAPAHEQWRIGAPIPKPERGHDVSVLKLTGSVPEMAREIDALRFQFEKLQKRVEIASKGMFSQGLRDKARSDLDAFAADSLEKIRDLNSDIMRVANNSLWKGFKDPGSIDNYPRGILHIPDNKNLCLRVQGNTALVTVDFETNIANDKALQMIKASIEDYWQGKFVFAGKRMRFKTTVTIRKLAPGQGFSPGSLTLQETVDVIAHAGKGGIVFDRDLSYDIPAHEFGHVLGLNDEYTEGYRASSRTAEHRQNTESLMGRLGGDILPRQLKTAYQLLRRRSRAKQP